MANPEHLDILDAGVEAWNRWRHEQPDVVPNLEKANLAGCELTAVDLHKARLWQADLEGAELTRADLRRAELTGASLEQVVLADADLTGAMAGRTVIGNVDLSHVIGLETVEHRSPSSIDFNALELTTIGLGRAPDRQGHIETFYRGAGVPEHLIAHYRSRLHKPIESRCFISYNSADQVHVEKLLAGLEARGIHCWAPRKDEDWMATLERDIRGVDSLVVFASEAYLQDSAAERQVWTAINKRKFPVVTVNIDPYLYSASYQGSCKDALRSRLAADLSDGQVEIEDLDRKLDQVAVALQHDQPDAQQHPRNEIDELYQQLADLRCQSKGTEEPEAEETRRSTLKRLRALQAIEAGKITKRLDAALLMPRDAGRKALDRADALLGENGSIPG